MFRGKVIGLCAALVLLSSTWVRAEEKNIVETAIAAKDFTTLVAALKAADLVTTLEGTGPFTVFAPSDEAFKKLGVNTLNDLLKPQNKQKLISILKYHVVSGKVLAKDVARMSEVKTVEGANLAIKQVGGKVMVDQAHVQTTDIQCTNGVIHVIDTVLMPPSALRHASSADVVSSRTEAGWAGHTTTL